MRSVSSIKKKKCDVIDTSERNSFLDIDDGENLWLLFVAYLHSRVGNGFHFCAL